MVSDSCFLRSSKFSTKPILQDYLRNPGENSSAKAGLSGVSATDFKLLQYRFQNKCLVRTKFDCLLLLPQIDPFVVDVYPVFRDRSKFGILSCILTGCKVHVVDEVDLVTFLMFPHRQVSVGSASALFKIQEVLHMRLRELRTELTKGVNFHLVRSMNSFNWIFLSSGFE